MENTPSNKFNTINNVIDWFRQMPKTVSIILAFLIVIIVGGYFIFEKKNESDEINRDVILKQMDYNREVQRVIDSVNAIEKERYVRRSLKDEIEKRETIRRYSDLFDEETHVTLWWLHDSGDPLSPGSKTLISVKYSSTKDVNLDLMADWQDRPAYGGHIYLARTAIENGYSYVPDLDNPSEEFSGKALQYSKMIGNESFIIVFLKNNDNSYWFITAGFKSKNVLEKYPRLGIGLDNLAQQLRPLIYTAPEYLKL